MFRGRIILAGMATMLVGVFATVDAMADSYNLKYEVTITNLTAGQTFTPLLVATHSKRVTLFEPGGAAGTPLEMLAEAGDTAPLTTLLLEKPYETADVQTVPGLLGPGQSVTVQVAATRHQPYLSMAAMLIPTNDTFVGVDSVRLPLRSRTVTAQAYDAGTEANDQNCLNIPGPRCGGEGYSPGPNPGDEGHVHVSNGFHGLPPADIGEVLEPQTYDWRNPVARIVVRRLR